MIARQTTYAALFAMMLVNGSRDLDAQDFFEQTKGPAGGAFMSLARMGEDTIVGGLGTGELHISTDRGRSWRRRFSTFSNRVQKVMASPAGRLFAFVGYTNDSLFYSDDVGLKFFRAPGLDTVRQMTSLAFGTGGIMIATSNGGSAYRSTDLDSGFERITIGEGRPLYVFDDGAGTLFSLNVFGGTDRGKWRAYRSTDDGLTWSVYGDTLQSGEDAVTMSYFGHTTATLSAAGTIIVSTQDHGVFRMEAGSNPAWQSGVGLPVNTRARSVTVAGDGTLYVATELGIYRSIDDGRSWTAPGRAGIGNSGGSLLGLVDGSVLATAGIVYHSNDRGDSWSPATLATINSNVAGLAISRQGTLFAEHGRTIARSTDQGESWEALPVTTRARAHIVSIVPTDNGKLFAGSSSYSVNTVAGGDIFRSTDNGISWQTVNQGLLAGNIFDLATRDGRIFAATDSGVFRSTDDGESWNVAREGLPYSLIRSLAIAPNGNLFAGPTGIFENGRPTGAGLWRSKDNGATWNEVNQGIDDPAFWWLEASPRGTLYAGAVQGGAYRSVNNGESWQPIDLGMPDSVWIAGIGVDHSGTAYLSYGNGTVWRSTDEGGRWERIDSLRFGFNVFVFDAGNRVFAGSAGAGIWRQKIASKVSPVPTLLSGILLTIVQREHDMEIRFELPRAGNLLLSLFDASGRRLRTLAEGRRSAGSHSLGLDTRELAAGVHVLHAEFEGSVSSRTFTIVR